MGEPVLCSCANPSGFTFISYDGGYQLWRHMLCGGQVVRPLVRMARGSSKSGLEIQKLKQSGRI